MTPEGRVKAKVKKALEVLGPNCWRFMPVQNGYGSVALDFLCSINGRFVAIETKAPGKKLTALQEGTKALIEAAGGIVLVVWDEPSLDIAMKIILALEFTPSGQTEIRDCLDATFPHKGGDPCLRNSLTAFKLGAPGYAKAAREYPKHSGAEQPSPAPDDAAGRDHGASGEPPKGRSKPS